MQPLYMGKGRFACQVLVQLSNGNRELGYIHLEMGDLFDVIVQFQGKVILSSARSEIPLTLMSVKMARSSRIALSSSIKSAISVVPYQHTRRDSLP